MEQFADVVLDLKGNAVQGASVRVLNLDDSLANIYDAGGSIVQNPVSTGNFGGFSFYAPNGKYFIEVSVGSDLLTTVGPQSFYDPDDDPDRAIITALATSQGAGRIGYIPSGEGAVQSTIEAELRRVCYWEGFKQPGDNDDTASLVRAIASGAERIRFRGTKNIGGHVLFHNPLIFQGDGRLSQINFTNNDAWFKFQGTPTAKVQGIVFQDMTLSGYGFNTVPHVFADWAHQLKFNNVFRYHCGFSFNHMNFWSISDSEVYDSRTDVRYTQDNGEPNQVSGAPKLTANFFSASPIYMEDCVDFQAVNNHFFQDGPVSRLVNWTNKGEGVSPDERPKSTFLITNNFFDSIHGSAWDFWDVGITSIVGNFVSAGRTNQVDGAYMYRAWHVKAADNTFVYCGGYGLKLEDCNNNKITDNDFIGNRLGGLATVNNCEDVKVFDNDFANLPSVYGGSYVQPIGYIDIGQTGKNIRVMRNGFRSMAQSVSMSVTKANKNIIEGNDGTIDVLADGRIGPTSERPTGVQDGFGPYTDTTIGKPIWYINGAWRDAMSAVV